MGKMYGELRWLPGLLRAAGGAAVIVLVTCFVWASIPTSDARITSLPQTYAELSEVKSKFRPKFDANSSNVTVKLTDPRFLDLIDAIQSTAKLMQSSQPGKTPESVIANYSLVTVLTDFAHTWMKASRQSKATDAMVEFKRASTGMRKSYKVSWSKLDLDHLTAKAIWEAGTEIRESLPRLVNSVDLLRRELKVEKGKPGATLEQQ